MNKKFVAVVAVFAALCGMVSAPANAAETVQSIREDVTPHVLVPIPVPDHEPVSEPEPVDIDALATAVIRGEYGVGEARRAALGDNYDAVQARVNELVPVAAPVVSQPVQAAPVVAPQAAPQSYTFEDVYNLAVNSPYCELEDGSDLPQCYWHDGAGDGSEPPYTDIVYMPDGYGYQAHEDTMTVSVFARNPWL